MTDVAGPTDPRWRHAEGHAADTPAVPEALAWFDGVLATDLVEVTDDLAALDTSGWWAVVLPYEGPPVCARFARVRRAPLPDRPWQGPAAAAWRSSLDREAYLAAARSVRERIAAGTVYQVNLCRVLRAPLPPDADLLGLAAVLAAGNPAPYAGVVRLPGAEVVTASPELYLHRTRDLVASGPIKGTAPTPAGFSEKDRAENVMIVDLVRNDLGRVCRTGTVEVARLLDVERHPGLAHLVSTVRGRLRPGAGWRELVTATFPPGSVTGAPKSSALRAIDALEPVARGPYCGALGWVDADRATGTLAVAIRTFWREDATLCFGTGAGITWGSDPAGEWAETELKAARLVGLASGADGQAGDSDDDAEVGTT